MSAWQELGQFIPELRQRYEVTGALSLYRFEPEMTYRTGLRLAAAPAAGDLPSGLSYIKFIGGKYSRFILTGPYSLLPAANTRVFEIVEERKIQLRDDWFIENGVNTPETTLEEELITEILLPVV